MPNHLIIDGYNLLGAFSNHVFDQSNDLETAREQLLRSLTHYRERMGHTITVVFDAWKQPAGKPHHEHRAGLTVLFTRQGERADQVIQRLIRSEGSDCVVVSSDHEIISTAESHGAMVIRAKGFLEKLQRRSLKAYSHKLEKSGEDESSGMVNRPQKKGNPRKLPKAVRQRLRKMKKF